VKRLVVAAIAIVFAVALGCFGARPNTRSYYVLGNEPVEPFEKPLFTGLIRVRDMDSDSIYDKFQIVLRKSPYELNYSEQNVWAVKPNKMVSDVLAQTLQATNTFAAVTRELGETRPDYLLAGDLRAIEIYDSDDTWFAHLSIVLHMTHFSTGETLWSHQFDARKQIERDNYSHAVRGISELLTGAIIEGLDGLKGKYALPRKGEEPAKIEPESQQIYVPEGAPDPKDLNLDAGAPEDGGE
jgi:ABC-type uncharacterized transport system auxiliary subunit